MTIYEQQLLNDFATWYMAKVDEAIKTYPVKRTSRGKGSFAAPVHASGKLAASVRSELTNEQLHVLAASYINDLIYGVAPRQSNFTVLEIEQWLATKGLDFNPATVAENIDRYGTSIYQEYKGMDSGLLSHINITDKVEEMKSKLAKLKADELLKQLVQPFRELEVAA